MWCKRAHRVRFYVNVHVYVSCLQNLPVAMFFFVETRRDTSRAAVTFISSMTFVSSLFTAINEQWMDFLALRLLETLY